MNKIDSVLEKIRFLFFWSKFFYPKANGIPLSFQLYFFFPQKVLRINGKVPWPVHPTSRILFHKNIKVGNRCAPGMNSCCYIQARNGIVMGHNVRIGPGVGIISAGHSMDDYDIHEDHAPINIGSNVWLGMNSVILPGITIGDNVVIGAGSVVTGNIPPDSIAAGNPCKVIKAKPPYLGFDYSL